MYKPFLKDQNIYMNHDRRDPSSPPHYFFVTVSYGAPSSCLYLSTPRLCVVGVQKTAYLASILTEVSPLTYPLA
jgi:hypothetical protein